MTNLPEDFSYEQSIQKVQTILAQLEQGNLSFEQSLALYKEGSQLVQACESFLQNAELTIEQITLNSSGEIQKANFEF
jgi:exodeoxyribonuclease VII small subunit